MADDSKGRHNRVKVSVIIPVYNRESYLAQCIESVITQTLEEIEVICVNDGSTDNTLKVINSYVAKDKRITVINQNRCGPGKARNYGISIASGEYVAFMDSDDYYPSDDVLEFLYRAAITHNAEMAGGSILREVNGDVYSQNSLCFQDNKLYMKGELIVRGGFTRFLFKRKMIIEKGIVFPPYTQNEDHQFLFNCALESERIWTTQKEVYVTREYDKRINIESENVIADVVSGYTDIMKMTVKYNFLMPQKTIVEEMEDRWGTLISWYLCNNSRMIRNKMSELLEIIAFDELKMQYKEYWSRNEVIKRVDEQIQREKYYKNIISEYKEIAIFGSGRIGKSVYDFISNMGETRRIEFVISSKNPSGTARGLTVKSIYDFTEKVNDILVIVAKQGDHKDMINTISEIGFKHVLRIERNVFGLSCFNMNNSRFAY